MKHVLLTSAAMAALFAASTFVPASAATLDEVVARLNALEQSNHKLAEENAQLRRKFSTVESVKVRSSREVSKEVSREVSRQVAATHVAIAPAPSNSLISYSPIGASVNNGVARAFLEKEKGDKLNFTTPNGEILLYGNLDVSADYVTKGISNLRAPDGSGPVGNVGYLGDISGNKSFVGVRGFQNIGATPFKLVYQLETQIDIASTSGSSESNSAKSNVVKGGLTSRNSFIGISSPEWGILRFGKTDAPYAQSTSKLDPFSGMLGSYQVIMGNSGGDNRVEFGSRLDHSIWYESPNVRGFKFAALFSPGQNRGYQNDNIASGEADCTGGNIPGSGGTTGLQGYVPGMPAGLNNCSDGSYGNAVSASLTYTNGPFYAVAAYERHFGVNRSSDITGFGGAAPYYYVQGDTADEDAAKVALQYELPTHTTISGIFESLHRYVPDYLQFQNERQRLGTWLAIEQHLTPKDDIAVGWAHAFKSPGDPGQHNSTVTPAPYGMGEMFGGTGVDNSANMFTAVYKRKIMPGLTFYTNAAATINAPFAHYDLGAGGHGVTTDGHDGFGAAGGSNSTPHIWAGGHLFGVSTGLNYNF
jgi:predicted porin